MSDILVSKNKLRAKVYWWLERPDREAWGPKLLEVALVVLIILNVSAVILETVDSIYQSWERAFSVFEGISLCIFILEYLLRLWIVPENQDSPSRISWMRSPIAIIDLLAILPALLYLFIPIDLRILRTFRMLRLLKLTRYSPALGMLLAAGPLRAAPVAAAPYLGPVFELAAGPCLAAAPVPEALG